MRRFLPLLMLLASASLIQAQQPWPQFRGPTGDGHGKAVNLPDTWSESQNIAWKAPIAGRGWSSPVIADNVAWMTSATVTPITEEEKARIRKEKLATNPMVNQMDIGGPVKMFAVGVDLTSGKIIKTIALFEVEEPDPIHSLNSYASPTPILDGNKLYCHFGRFGTACADVATGNILWKTQLVIDHSVGPGSTPVLHDGVLIVPCDGCDMQYVTGLDANTGEQRWRTDRPPLEGSLGDIHKAFGTPLVVTHNGIPQVISVGAQWFVAYEPATGREIWRFRYGNGFSNVPRPVVAGNIAYLCTGLLRRKFPPCASMARET